MEAHVEWAKIKQTHNAVAPSRNRFRIHNDFFVKRTTSSTVSLFDPRHGILMTSNFRRKRFGSFLLLFDLYSRTLECFLAKQPWRAPKKVTKRMKRNKWCFVIPKGGFIFAGCSRKDGKKRTQTSPFLFIPLWQWQLISKTEGKANLTCDLRHQIVAWKLAMLSHPISSIWGALKKKEIYHQHRCKTVTVPERGISGWLLEDCSRCRSGNISSWIRTIIRSDWFLSRQRHSYSYWLFS